VLTVCALGHVCTGANPAIHLYLTVTGVVFHPFALGAGDTLAVIVGKVVLTFNVTLVDALFPATSVAVPVITWLAPCATVTGPGHEAIPEIASEQVNVTVAFWLIHPLLLGAGETAAVITGGLVSMFNVTDAVAVAPEASFAVPVMT
jgi:hypothetical protein